MAILDTDMLTLFRNGHASVVYRVNATPREQIFVTIISVQEQIQGWYNLLNRQDTAAKTADVYQRLLETVKFLSELNVLNFSENAVLRFEALKRMKLNVKPMDLRIAAIALENGETVVTRNVRDFQRVPSLQVEDWSSD